jgi:hypothetical protein
MHALQDENRRLRKAVAELVLEKEALKVIARGNLSRFHSASSCESRDKAAADQRTQRPARSWM